MSYARIEYEQTNTGNRTFSVPFPYISQDDIVISVDGTEVTYEWLNSATVRLDEAPEVGAIIGIYRETERAELLVDYKDGSTLTESDLDLAALQTFFIAQEAFDQTGSSLDVANDGSYSATGRRISNLADPVYDQDAVTKLWVMNQYNSGVDAGEALEATEEARAIAVDAATSASEDLASIQTLYDEVEVNTNTAVSSAATAVSAAETSTSNLEDFLGQYWGSYASEPTLDPNGEAPSGGDLYYNTTTETLRIYNETGSYWKDVGSNAEGLLYREDYVATDGQTTFSVSYDAPFVIVNVNGYTLPTSDYIATDGATVVLNEGVTAGDEVSLLGFSALVLGDVFTKTEMITLMTELVDDVNEAIDMVTAYTVPTGAVQAFAMQTAPSGWLTADGSAVSRTTYAALYAAIGDTYGSGDGSTTFNLPDLRGEFIRGYDDGRDVDSGRAFGSWQDSTNRSHNHDSGVRNNGSPSLQSGNLNLAVLHGGTVSLPIVYTGSQGGDEARPRNIALLYCIKY